MIVYAMIIRARDGMALSASTDSTGEVNRSLKGSKHYIKLLAKRANLLPDRCVLKLNSYVIYLVTSLGVSYVALCEPCYPCVLAVSFLDEIMREFAIVYDVRRVNEVRRPYAFIEFDNFIHKTRQRYNNPRSLTTRVNLTDLSNDIKIRPPYVLKMQDIEPVQNGVSRSAVPSMSVGPLPHLEPISWIGIVAMALSSFCALINFYRGISALGMPIIEEYDSPNPHYAMCFLVECALQCSQIFLLLVYSHYRNIKTAAALLSLCLCNLYVWEVRELWLILLHVAVGSAITFATVIRNFETKPPNYNV